MSFKEISAKEIDVNFVKIISDDWGIICAGSMNKWNGMTVSWGGIGELWGEDVVFVFIRPQRYTYEFFEQNGDFSINFFDNSYKKALQLFGSKSGRDIDKGVEAGLNAFNMSGTVGIKEAKMIIECRKVAFQDINPNGFVDKDSIEKWYSGDYHRMYIGAIRTVLVKE